MLVVLLHEASQEHPHCMKEHFLKTTGELHTLAISQSSHNAPITSIVTKEIKLGHIAAFFKARRALGLFERMAQAPVEIAGGEQVNSGNGEAPRYMDLAYWTRKTQA